jgi:hypothetical protein
MHNLFYIHMLLHLIIFLFNKFNKFVTQKMKSIFDKCKCDDIKAFERIKFFLENAFLNAHQMSI